MKGPNDASHPQHLSRFRSQISVEDLPAIKAAGVTRLINNRPDGEVPPSHCGASIEAAAKDHGIEIVHLPITHTTMTPENVSKQMELVAEAEGTVLAYCASGTRCTVIWALGQVGQMSADEIIEAAAQGGYDLSGLRPNLG
ncbi:MAG: TIGR01244 family phosphatase [Rhodobacteraceae bacterium]|nr:TIGR01244 family phosphatase [Paracoccaceae bacterium]